MGALPIQIESKRELPDYLPARMVNEYAYCPRLFFYEWVEGLFAESVDTVEGMDAYDPVSNTLFPTDKERIAAWFLDTDYDGRTFCICQAFFPDKSKWDKLAKALSDVEIGRAS